MSGARQQEAREAARVAALREARTQALARRGATAERAREGRAVLVCACGSERFGIPTGEVLRVLPLRACTPLPGAPPAILGIVALSGAIVTVVGLAAALGRPGAAAPEAGHLLHLSGPVPIALAVDRVLGTAQAGTEAAPGLDGLGSAAVSGYAPAGDEPSGLGDFTVIDLTRLLRRYLP
ncbi:chemotaxis protein CheW [Methylobacterium sp. A54F]